MRLPRLTTRRLMVVVAVAGIALTLGIRRQRFHSLAYDHMSEWSEIQNKLSEDMLKPLEDMAAVQPLKAEVDRMLARALWHRKMSRRYLLAARYPWLPVPPDPPEPK